MAKTQKAAPAAKTQKAAPAAGELEDQTQTTDNQEVSAEDVIYAQAASGQGGLSLVPTKKVKKNHTVEAVVVNKKTIERDGFTVVKAKK